LVRAASHENNIDAPIGRTSLSRLIVLNISSFAETQNKHSEQWDLMLLGEISDHAFGPPSTQTEIVSFITCPIRESSYFKNVVLGILERSGELIEAGAPGTKSSNPGVQNVF
jgi:hypothetical protein